MYLIYLSELISPDHIQFNIFSYGEKYHMDNYILMV